MHRVTELDYEVLSDRDIRQDTFHVVHHAGMDTLMPQKGVFRRRRRVTAAATMDPRRGENTLPE